MNEMEVRDVKKQALEELREERFREEVEKHKQKLRDKKSILDRLFPFRITIIRKGKDNG